MPDTEYHIHMDRGFAPLEVIDVPQLVASCEVDWFNQTLTEANDCVVPPGQHGKQKGWGWAHRWGSLASSSALASSASPFRGTWRTG